MRSILSGTITPSFSIRVSLVLIAFGSLLLPWIASASTSGAAPESDTVAQDAAMLESQLGFIESYSAAFHQTVFDINGLQIQSYEGRVEAKRPNLLRWETLSPMEQLIVGDGEKIWLYDPDLLQVTVQNYPENVAETPAMLLIGQFEGLRDNYDITVLDSDVSTTLYQLQPRDHSGQFSLIILGVSEGVPVSLSMTDALQQVTRIEFAEVAIDRELSPPLFHFELPEGVDLIRNDN